MKKHTSAAGKARRRFGSAVYVPWLALVTLLLTMSPAFGQRAEKATLSLRAGFPVNKNDTGFRQYEFYSDRRLPATVRLPGELLFSIRLDATASLLTQAQRAGFIFAAGPGFMLSRVGGRLALKFGISAAVLSNAKFARKNLGGWFHFISHIGVSLRLGHTCGVVYRVQHMSNASLAQPNPGINLHMLGLGLWFE